MNSFFGQPHERKAEQLVFHIQRHDELNVPPNFSNLAQAVPLNPQYRDYCCGSCGKNTSGRVLCDLTRVTDGAKVQWCVCACERMEPAVFVSKDGVDSMQQPMPRKFHADPNWPHDLAQLYEEAAVSFAAGAYTSASMVCRKLLMATACQEGDTDGKNFAQYVDYVTNVALTYPKAKASIDKIRDIGNDANHKIDFVTPADAEKAMQIVTYMLTALYSLPAA
jgi:hypothetical protein